VLFRSNLENIDNLTIRMYMQDYKWHIKERLLEINKNLNFDNKTNYYKQISNARLNIFDHMHTGYLETLSMNIPTVIIIPKNIYYFRDSAKPYIQKLKDVNILFDNPLEASNFVDEIYDDIDSWWLSDEVQKVREEFCYNYARTSENWADEWVKEFSKVLEK
jgi:putative transferase (TIGR04331 family)